MATIKDVAGQAKVSVSTVSKVLNHKSASISEETKSRIFQIADDLNYKSNRNKENAKVEKKIGILTWCSQQDESNDPYFLAIRQGIEAQCSALNIQISKVIRMSESAPKQLNVDLDGLIVIGKVDIDDLRKTFFREDRIVFVNQTIENLNFDTVVADFDKVTKDALHHLIKLGHTRIGYIGGEEYLQKFDGTKGETALEIRKDKYFEIMQQKGLFQSRHVYIGDWSISSGYELMKQALAADELPSAFFIASDNLAIGAIHALNEAGLQVPKDVAIISCDDIELAAYVNPALSTIKVHPEQMGKSAVNLLFERMNGRDIPIKVVIPTQQICRDSCGCKR